MYHSDRRNRRLNCRMAPACKETFNNIRELGIHSRQVHRAAYPFRCNYKDCFDCYRTIVKHGKTHGKETWDATHSPEDKKDRYKCSLCPEMFDLVAQLLSHTQVHEENMYHSSRGNHLLCRKASTTISIALETITYSVCRLSWHRVVRFIDLHFFSRKTFEGHVCLTIFFALCVVIYT